MFASLLLMPSDGIMQMIPPKEQMMGNVTMATLLRLEHYFSVSRMAMVNRLIDLGFVHRENKPWYTAHPMQDARDYGYNLALYCKGNENLIIGRIGELAHRLFDAELISEGHYLEILNKIENAPED